MYFIIPKCSPLLQDFDGSTPYDLACLHGQYECARLLRSLHWAKKKDKDLDTTLKEEHIQKTREKEYLALHSRLRMEAAEYAYEEWLEQKDIPRSQTPSACEERREVRSRASQKSVSCTSCTRSRASSKQQSATTKTPKANCTIKVNPHQQAHNIQAVGTPKKLYPYTNYPPKHLRCSSASHSKTKSAVRSGRRSRTTVQNTSQSEPILVTQTSTNKTNSTSSADSSQTSLVPASVVDEKVIENKTISEESSNEIAVFNLKSETSTGQFSSQDEDEEEFLFHDVGHTNNLEALALPNLITKDKTQGELIQLLQSLGEKESGPRDFTRSHSLHVRRNSAHGGTHRRMLSLGALPEGRMVTSYSDEELSVEPSQILDESFLEEFVKTFSSSQEASEERMAPKIGWEDNQNKNDIPLVAISDVQNAISRRSSLTLPLSDLHKNSPNSRSDQTLKVVNMEWDAKLGCVQSVITESPLTPPPDTHQRKLLSPRLSPPLASMRHSPVEYS